MTPAPDKIARTAEPASAHRREPWTKCQEVAGAPVRIMATAWHGRGSIASFSAIEDADRCIACVNALAGIPDPAAAIRQAREALAKIARGEGAFDRDPLKHAGNVIEEAKTLAAAALAALSGEA